MKGASEAKRSRAHSPEERSERLREFISKLNAAHARTRTDCLLILRLFMRVLRSIGLSRAGEGPQGMSTLIMPYLRPAESEGDNMISAPTPRGERLTKVN